MASGDRSEEVEARLEALLAAYGTLIRRAIERLCPRNLGISVDDVEQEARLKVWKVLESEREVTRPSSFLYKVAVNAALDAIRQVKARREEAWTKGIGPAGGERESERPSDPREAPDRLAERRDLARKMARPAAREAAPRRPAPPPGLHERGGRPPSLVERAQGEEPDLSRARRPSRRAARDGNRQ